MADSPDYSEITTPAAHHTTHEKGGNDEISAANLTGLDSVLPWWIDINVYHTAKSNTNWDKLYRNANEIFNGSKETTGEQNAEIVWDVVLAKGTWVIEIFYYKYTNQGIISIQLNGVEKDTLDLYGAAIEWNLRSSTVPIVIAATAKYELKLKMLTKNAASTGYYGTILGVRLLRTS